MKNNIKNPNPFPYSDTNKRYHTYDYYLRHRYGGKCVKLSLDAGLGCPNIDGRCGIGGCIYCSPRGSGDFAFRGLSITAQYEAQRQLLSHKWETARCIPYLQAHTNTYASPETLRCIYDEVLSLPDAVAFHIATRADCLGPDVLKLLCEVSQKIDLTVELGLQSVHDATAARINRGHTFSDFAQGYRALRREVPRARIGIHLIDGLPGEDAEMMLKTAKTVAGLMPDEIKFHLLHVVSGTRLATIYEAGKYTPLTLAEYVEILVAQLEVLPPTIVVGRVTGDGDPHTLLAPLWSLKKFTVINAIDREMEQKNTFQGKNSDFGV